MVDAVYVERTTVNNCVYSIDHGMNVAPYISILFSIMRSVAAVCHACTRCFCQIDMHRQQSAGVTKQVTASSFA